MSRRRNGNWSGSKSTTYTVERVLRNGAYLPLPAVLDESFDDGSYEEIELSIQGYAGHEASYLSGAPENCYEGDDWLELEEVIDRDGNDWTSRLTDAERQVIEQQILDGIRDREPDYGDYEFDCYEDR